MTWRETMKAWGGGDISFLSEDGECVRFCVVGGPQLIEGKFRGNETKRVGLPIVTEEGFTLLTIGIRVARRLSKYENHFATRAFEIIRHGEQNDAKTSYELGFVEDKGVEDVLLAQAAHGVSEQEIAEAVSAAIEASTG